MGRRGPKAWPRVRTRNGKDYLRVTLSPGVRREYCLGVEGSPESKREYARIIAELEAGRVTAQKVPAGPGGPLVAALIVGFLEKSAARHDSRLMYRIVAAMTHLDAIYGGIPAREFGPGQLEVVRERYVEAGYCRKGCNALTSIVRQCFNWAAVRQMVPADVALALRLLPPLLPGDSEAPDYAPVPPVAIEVFERTLPFMPPVVADLARVQLYCGMRPGEAALLRGCDIDRDWRVVDGVPMWLFTLGKHKTRRRTLRDKLVPVGPRAQAVLAPYLASRGLEDYCFSPLESRQLWAERTGRKLNLGKSHTPRAYYHTTSYGHAVAAACARAGVEPWSPNQLRHAMATLVETEFGREDARCVLGHDEQSTTAIYAEEVERAARVLARLG